MEKEEFERTVKRLIDATDVDGNRLSLDSIIISDEVSHHKHLFKPNDELHELRSLSKSVLSMCMGILMYNEEYRDISEKINLDTKVWPKIKNRVNLTNNSNLPMLEKISIRHLLSHSIGHDKKMLKTADVKGIDPYTYLDLLCNTDIIHTPGERFLYSNGSPYMLSAYFQEISGRNVLDFATQHIFEKLGIDDFKWEMFGNYCAGATGLYLKSDDLHKIGRLIGDGGKHDSIQLVPEVWMKNMVVVQRLIPTMYDPSRTFPKYGYGYLMYICKDGSYFIDGTGGQYIIVIPQRKLVITILANQKDVAPITASLNHLLV